MKPPISYYGGKQRLARKIVKLIPEHRIYVDPYAGGAAVFFAKPLPTDKKYVEVLNDHDVRLINFYKVIQHPIKAYQLYTRLLFTPYSREVHRQAKSSCSPGIDGDVNAAYSYFINIMCSFSSCLGGGWRRSATSNKKSSEVLKNRVALLEKYVERLSGVFIECREAHDIIDIWEGPETFFYVDPPYPGSDQGHYKGFTAEDFSRLVNKLGTIKGSFLLSNYQQPNIPANWEKFNFPARASSGSARTEIVWRKLRA